MAGIAFPRDPIFRGWTEGETSRVVENIGEQNWALKEDPRIGKLRKRIAQHHISKVQESNFYSVRLVCPLDKAMKKHWLCARRWVYLATLVCIGVSIIFYWRTSSYFEDAWKVCQAIADKKEYVLAREIKTIGSQLPVNRLFHVGEKLSSSFCFIRYAATKDIWRFHPTVGVSGLEFLRNAFCFLLPISMASGLIVLFGLTGPCGKREWNLRVDRSKDERICPPNFDIQKDCDPLTQEVISVDKLHSPQMIYLPNYVTEAKSFVSALLLAGKKDFADPVYRRKFTKEERSQILSQIKRIFLISEEKFNQCFKNESDSEPSLDLIDFRRYATDKRVFNERGQFSKEAVMSLQEVFGEETQAMNAEIDRFADQLPNAQQRETVRRVIKMNALAISGYINGLKKDDKAYWRIRFFYEATGVDLRALSTESSE